jgi:hypothetical protein
MELAHMSSAFEYHQLNHNSRGWRVWNYGLTGDTQMQRTYVPIPFQKISRGIE